jgi:DNA-binding XRE family transcriptional regulator
MSVKRKAQNTFRQDLDEQLKDKEFKLAYDVGRAKLTLAHKLGEFREKAGWTQAELARRMNVSQQLVSRVESGSDNLTLATLVKFLGLFGVCMEVHVKKRAAQEVLEFV